MIWYDIILYDMIWHDMIWHDMIWYDMKWYHIIAYIYMPYIYIWYQGARDETKITQLWPSDGTPDSSVVNPGIPLGSCHAGYPISRPTQVTSSCSWYPKNIQILCAHDFGARKHGNLVVIVFFPLFFSIFFRSSMDDAVGHPVEEFGSAESQRYLRQDSLPVIFGPQIARIRNIDIIEGSLEVKLPTIWTDGKGEVGRVREEKRRRKKITKEKASEERRSRCAKR